MAAKSGSAARTERYRQKLRRRGLRPVQIWVPDTRSPGFPAEVRSQCERINAADQADGLMDWVENVSTFDDDDAR